MKKIPTLFQRDDRFKAIDKLTEGCEWVVGGEGFATEKLDGTNVRVQVYGGKVITVDKRRNPSREQKALGMEPGYVATDRKDPGDKWIFAAVDGTLSVSTWPDGEYACEAVGPKIQANRYALDKHILFPFMFLPVILENAPRTFEGLKKYFPHNSAYANYLSPPRTVPMEGIVWHHQDGRMVKLKARDF